MASNDSDNAPVILQLAVPSPLRRLFDYLPPEQDRQRPVSFWKPGIRLRVPFGRRQEVAILVATGRTSQVAGHRLKRAIEVLDENPLLPSPLLQTLGWASAYYQHPPGEVFSAAIPARLRRGGSAQPSQVTTWEAIPPTPGESLADLNRAPKQRALLNHLQKVGPQSRQDCEAAGFSNAIIRALADKGRIRARNVAAASARPSVPVNSLRHDGHQANAEQQSAIDAICATLKGYHCHLLDGVTGSGKTEVYMQVITRVLEQGRQALLLVPEIGLTPQSVDGFRARFDCDIVVLHSGLTDSRRQESWLRARDGSAGIVIGTRSAVFTPLAKPGVIVIDEEHDSSFKQQDGFRYSARDLAIFRARSEAITIVLGSATPALESLYNARNGRYSLLNLSRRAGDASRPGISLLDMVESESREGFALALLELIRHHLAEGNQVLVFINRRGFAPSLLCQDCGYVFECRRCDAQFTVHKTPPGLHCHHCESRQALPVSCAACGSTQLAARGFGTEKTEQFLQETFPHVPILRIDSDSTRRKDALARHLNKVQSGVPCILVGTQMLAKGHHFPGVTLVAVVNADSGLFSADFRGQEHMIQLLFQVAGRAGRAARQGQVIIQTRHAAHASLQALLANDYHRIADLLLQERRATNMPPFSHLALFRCESVQAALALDALREIHNLCISLIGTLRLEEIELNQPLPSPMEKRAGRFRAQMLLKSKARKPLQQLLSAACQQIETSKTIRRVKWSIDVDPQDLT